MTENTQTKSTESELEISVRSARPARAEKKFVTLYKLIEHTCDVEYDKYDWNYVNHHESNHGIFGSKKIASRKIKRLIQPWIKQGYYKLEMDNFIKVKDEFIFEDKRNRHRIRYIINPEKIALDKLIHKSDGIYLEFRNSKFTRELIKIQV